MRYCAWPAELSVDSLTHPEASGLARLAQAGLPVLPGWFVLPQVAIALFSQPELRVVIEREAKLVRRHPHAVSTAIHSVRQQLHTAKLPSPISRELELMLHQLRQHLVLPNQPIRLRLRIEDTVIERDIVDGEELEFALKQLYSLRVEDPHLLEQKKFQATEAIIHYASTDEVYGIAHARDDLTGDESVIQVVTDTQTFRLDRKSGQLLTGPADREVSDLDAAALSELARLISQAQDVLNEPQVFSWQRLYGRIWVDGIQPLAQVKRHRNRIGVAAHSGLVQGIVRKITSDAEFKRLKGGEIAVLDGLRAADHSRLIAASALISAYGSHYGLPAQLGRRLGIPVLSGLPPAQIDRLWTGQLVRVDGYAGTVHSGAALVGTVGSATKLLVRTEELGAAPTLGDGLLLSGTTGLLTLHALHPHEILRRQRSEEYGELLAEELCKAAAMTYPKPLFYRLHDGYTHGAQRGLHAALQRPEWLRIELRMLARAVREGACNLIPITPLLHDLQEVVQLRQHAEPYSGILERLWITCGTPAMAIQAEALQESDVSGICLDLTHLARLTLGVENNRERLHLARADHPAVLQQAEYLIGAAKAGGIATMIETDGTSLSQALINRVVTAGVDYLVVAEDSLQQVERIVSQVEQQLFQEYRLDAARSIC